MFTNESVVGSRIEAREKRVAIAHCPLSIRLENYREQRVHDNQMIAKLFAVTTRFTLLRMTIDGILLVLVRQFILECVLHSVFHSQIHSSIACKWK